MKKINIKFIAESAIIAALYAALTWLLAPISYGPVQFRISEVLVLLVVLNPKYSVALIIGCFVANTTSSLGWYDMVFGTLATTLAVIPMCFVKKIHISAIFPVLSNAFIVSLELGFAFELWGGAFWYDVFTVGIGELVVLYILGIPLMYGISNNSALVEIMELDATHMVPCKFFNLKNMSVICLGSLGAILYVAYPLYSNVIEEEAVNYSAMSMTLNMPFVVVFAVASVIYGVMVLVKNKWIKLIGMSFAIIAIIVTYILTGVFVKDCLSYGYYYGYIVFIGLLVLCTVLVTVKNDNTSNEEVSLEATNLETE